MSKLRNIDALNKMLAGEHKTQTKKTFGFSDVDSSAEKSKRREVGDVWEETDPKSGIVFIVEQKSGYRVRRAKNAVAFDELKSELRTFKHCPKETCTCVSPTRLDEKFRRLRGMCFDCVLAEETKLQITGKFEDFAKQKMRENAQSWLQQADQEVEEIKAALSSELSYVNQDGSSETWTSTNKEEMIRRIDEQYQQFKLNLLNSFDNVEGDGEN